MNGDFPRNLANKVSVNLFCIFIGSRDGGSNLSAKYKTVALRKKHDYITASIARLQIMERLYIVLMRRGSE